MASKRYADLPLGLTFGRSMDSSAFIFASAASMTHMCERRLTSKHIMNK
jgi:hypothetical protein